MNVNDVVAARIAEAKARREAVKARRAVQQAARQAGLAARRRAKLARFAEEESVAAGRPSEGLERPEVAGDVSADAVHLLVAADYQRGASAWVDELADRLITPQAPRCDHLRRRAAGPGVIYVDEGIGRCAACHVAHAAKRAVSDLQGTFGGVDGYAAGACDRCRARVGVDRLAVVAVEVDGWVLIGGLCPKCGVVLVREMRSVDL